MNAASSGSNTEPALLFGSWIFLLFTSSIALNRAFGHKSRWLGAVTLNKLPSPKRGVKVGEDRGRRKEGGSSYREQSVLAPKAAATAGRLQDLPRQLLCEISSFLGPACYLNLSSACSFMRKTLWDSEIYWRTCYIRHFGEPHRDICGSIRGKVCMFRGWRKTFFTMTRTYSDYLLVESRREQRSARRVLTRIHGVVYDLTNFDLHPGGQSILDDHAGKDATTEFELYAHSPNARAQLVNYEIYNPSRVRGKFGP